MTASYWMCTGGLQKRRASVDIFRDRSNMLSQVFTSRDYKSFIAVSIPTACRCLSIGNASCSVLHSWCILPAPSHQ